MAIIIDENNNKRRRIGRRKKQQQEKLGGLQADNSNIKEHQSTSESMQKSGVQKLVL